MLGFDSSQGCTSRAGLVLQDSLSQAIILAPAAVPLKP